MADVLAAVTAGLGDEIAEGTPGGTMMAKFGGQVRCLNRYVEMTGGADADAALAAVKATLVFRAANHVDDIEARITASGVLAKVEPYWFSSFNPKCCPDGSPVMYYKASVVNPAHILENVTEDEFREFYLYWMERGLALQLASISEGKTPPGVVEIYDIGGVGLSQIHIIGLMMLSRVLGLGQLHYPANLTKGYLINAPWFIEQGFSLVRPVLSQATIDALSISSTDCKEELLQLMSEAELAAMVVSVSPPPPVYPVDERGLSIATVAAGADHSIELELDEAQLSLGAAKVTYEFATEDMDVDFGISLRPLGAAAGGAEAALLPVARHEPSIFDDQPSVTGEVPCVSAGCYVVTFGNSYSWMSAKIVHFKVTLEMVESATGGGAGVGESVEVDQSVEAAPAPE